MIIRYKNIDRFNTRKGFRRYQNYDFPIQGETLDEMSYAGTPVTEITRKNPPVRGDHKGNFPYNASGFRMTQDIPRSIHTRVEREFNNVGSPGKHWDVERDYVSTSWLSCGEQVWTFNGNFPEVERPNLNSESITGALNDLAEQQVSGGAAVAEGRQVVDMFASNVSVLGRALLQAKRGNFGSIPKILGMERKDILTGKYPANKFLEYQYGWKPLMSDIHDAQEKAHEVLLQDYVLTGSKSVSAENYSESHHFGEKKTLRSKISVRTQIKAKISNPALHGISTWGLLNPVAIAWELVPFSFVIDWFMPVGNTLNAATAGCGLTSLGGSTMNKYIATYTHTGSKLSTREDSVLSPGYVEGKSWDVDRFIYHEFPHARFYADTTPFSSPRVANATALLRQLR